MMDDKVLNWTRLMRVRSDATGNARMMLLVKFFIRSKLLYPPGADAMLVD